MTFEEIIDRVIESEGGYVNDPDDPGGETKYGISKRAYPEIVIKDLTIKQAKQIYYEDYWTPSKADQLSDQLKEIYLAV